MDLLLLLSSLVPPFSLDTEFCLSATMPPTAPTSIPRSWWRELSYLLFYSSVKTRAKTNVNHINQNYLNLKPLSASVVISSHLLQEKCRSFRAKELLIVLYQDLDKGWDFLAVVLIHHVGGIWAPQDTWANADGQVWGRHHVLLQMNLG